MNKVVCVWLLVQRTANYFFFLNQALWLQYEKKDDVVLIASVVRRKGSGKVWKYHSVDF